MSHPILNKERLIYLIRERPALWNKTLDVYKDKNVRTAAWREICGILNKKYEELGETEKQKYCKLVIKTWTHTRDSWVRSLNTRKVAKKLGSVSRPYKYNKQMMFLKKVIGLVKERVVIESEESGEEEEEEVNADSECDSVVYCENEWTTTVKEEVEDAIRPEIQEEIDNDTPKRQERIENTEPYDKMIHYINSQMKTTIEKYQEDRHLAFFRGIQPSLTLLDDDEVLEFQSGVINLIRRIKSGRNNWNKGQSSNSESRVYYTEPETVTANIVLQSAVKDCHEF